MKYIIFISFLLATAFADEEAPSQPEQQPAKLPLESEKNLLLENALNSAPPEQSEQVVNQPEELKRPQRHLLLEAYEQPVVLALQSQYLYPYPQVYYQPATFYSQPYVLQKLAKK